MVTACVLWKWFLWSVETPIFMPREIAQCCTAPFHSTITIATIAMILLTTVTGI